MPNPVCADRSIQLLPVEKAPTGEGEFGPCLLAPVSEFKGLDYTIGYRKGVVWYSYWTGARIYPKMYALLGAFKSLAVISGLG